MTYPLFSDEYFMNEALKQAKLAMENDEIPVGAVIVSNNQIIARAHNQTEQLNDVTAHAEMLAITAAEGYLGSKFLDDCTLFVSLEPCLMCAAAASWARFERIVFGARDEKAGFLAYGEKVLHSKTQLKYSVLEQECSELLKNFFAKKRKEK